jgi:hypothetical protein
MKRGLLAALPAFAALAAWAPTVQADDASPASGEDVQSDLADYYRGERISAYVIGGMGAAAVGGGAFLVTRDTDFARGLGWSWIGLGGFEALGAAFYALQVGSEIDHYEGVLARDPAAYRAEEADHITGTRSRFVVYRTAELALMLGGAGMAAYGFAANADAWKGTGVGVFSLSAPLAVIDTVNNARARRYLDEVRAFRPTIGVQTHGLTLSIGRTF